MVRLEMNGKPFDPQTFAEEITKGIMENAAAEMQQRISSIRHPQTGEFPTVVVSVTSGSDMKVTIEGSPELLAIVEKDMDQTGSANEGDIVSRKTEKSPPQVFLSYAWEDRELAGQIAKAFQGNGIETFWAEWSIGPGDSLVQKINEGLADCTHFVVLLTPVSLKKPWVQQEMDAGLVRKINAQCTFIALRHNVAAPQLPPLLATLLSPEIRDVDADVRQLVNDIHGVSRKPPLGAAPVAIMSKAANSGWSPSAIAVARVFVEASEHGEWASPQVDVDTLAEDTGLTPDDVEDALHELSGVIEDHHGVIFPKAELFATFDGLFKDWNPAEDALLLAAAMVNNADFPGDPPGMAVELGWQPRRLNPAIAYLHARTLVVGHAALGMTPFNFYAVERTAATRRFVRSRS